MKTFTLILSALVLLVLAVKVESQQDAESRLLKIAKELDIDVSGDTLHRKMVGNPGLQLHKLALSDEESAMVDALIEQMKKDPRTVEMVTRMKSEEAETLEMMIGGMSGPEKVKNLQQILSELKAVEILFKDPARALKVMNEDGMVPANRLPEYQRNPALLEEDTRKGLYFSFVTMAVSLGLL
mmetsp:Transcript_20933/g.34583  ORF Transcript_20933/g.34583 Transcript_20933/m.34583 type:complete len:183 (+) Transcript_20933:118-666(+)|eukprot:CAMPEP_0119013234 /NCGR_PEP_ID=MMETSP1176-20130426/8212_1 /TAXON_ID=265551 /ORGANISM="Synedropsis recta cf, Strain CCMP1620" /LENGTH=182 /DNA_ID=CAMNT_0006966311 /DNA_START=109 /DNA_END=657 /DNA_ORIENTATION=-